MRTVVVDDDLLTSTLLAEFLKNAGLGVATLATSAVEALEVFSAPGIQFDYIFLDVHMPGFNGIELCQWLRNQNQFQSSCIVIVTGSVDRAQIDRAFAAGATDFLTKPLNGHQIGSCLKRIEASVASDARRAAENNGPLAVPARVDGSYIDFSDPITILGIASALSYSVFARLAARLPPAKLLRTSFFAFKIVDVGKIYARSTSTEFVGVLQEVGGAISRGLSHTDVSFAYAGEGAFLCMKYGREPLDC